MVTACSGTRLGVVVWGGADKRNAHMSYEGVTATVIMEKVGKK